MKPKTSELMKFKRLCRRLGESKRGVVGLLELLWHGTATNCPRGDIGKFPDEEIAIMCDYGGEPAELVAALTETGWIDPCPTHRLVVHDWREHAPDYIKGSLKRWGKDFASVSADGIDASDSSLGIMPQQNPSSPILPLPSKSIDRCDRPNAVDYAPELVDAVVWESARDDFKRTSDTLGDGRGLRDRDRETVVRCVLVARARLPVGTLDDLLMKIREGVHRDEIKKPFAYFRKSIIRACEAEGVEFHRAAAALQIEPALLCKPQPQP